MNYSIFSIIIFLLIVLALIMVIFRVREQEEEKVSDTQHTQEVPQEKSKNKSILIAIITAIVLAVGAIVYIELKKHSGGNGDNDNSFVAFIPIWAAFIPIFAANKKRQQKISTEKRRLIAILIGLVVLGLAAMIFFGLMN